MRKILPARHLPPVATTPDPEDAAAVTPADGVADNPRCRDARRDTFEGEDARPGPGGVG
jgi:hypothetical protein